MAQCKKILKNGERCTNPCVSDLGYCEKHWFTKFRRVSEKQKADNLQHKKRRSPQTAEAPKWSAQPLSPGDSPGFPGLRADKRNALIARRGIIRIREKGAKDRPDPLFGRLAGLVSHLSQKMSLAEHISVWTMPGKSDAMVLIIPPASESDDLSHFYDAASSAADMNGGTLYIGEKRAFIRYRNGAAPRGYDARDVRIPKNDSHLFFTDIGGTTAVPVKSLTRESLSDLLLSIPPIPATAPDLPETLFVLVPQPLFRMLARYFRDHRLHYRAARFHIQEKDVLTLFEVSPRADAADSFVPAFVISYLRDLPRCTVFTHAGSDDGRRVLAEWGKRCSCMPRNILSAFPEECLLLFTTGPDFPNLCVSPAPAFFDGDERISLQTPRVKSVGATFETDEKSMTLEIPVRLIRDPGPVPFPAALILDTEETEWVRRLLWRIPGNLFEDCRFCMGEEQSVLIGERIPIQTLPFGIPLRRFRDTRLFIPLNTRLVPDLPWTSLSRAMNIGTDINTFLTREFRVDIPRDAFAPLSKSLIAEPERPRTVFHLRPPSRLPELKWTPPATLKKREQKGILRRFKKAVKPFGTAKPAEQKEIKETLRKQARSYHKAGDYLSAALCFAMSDDDAKAAECYQEAARNQALANQFSSSC